MQFAIDAAEAARLAALTEYDILDTSREKDFDDVAALASAVCGTPIAVVNLIAEGRQFFKAEVGLGVRETPLETSFCAKAILEQELLVVPDATQDPRFNCNPLVTGPPHLRFYAGALLRTEAGHALGTVCVLDFAPRSLSDVQIETLRVLARQVMKQLELRKALREQQAREVLHRRVLESATDYAIISLDLGGLVTGWNRGAELILGWSEPEMLGHTAAAIFTDEDRAAGVPAHEMEQALSTGRGSDERWHMRKDGSRLFGLGEMMCLRAEDGRQVGFLKILRDRTRQRQAELALLESEKRLRLAQQAGKIGSFDVEVATDLMTVSTEFCRLLGLPVEPVYPASVVEALVVADDAGIRSSAASRLDGSAPHAVEYRVLRADDGRLRWIARSADFMPDESGKVVRMFGTVQDVTDRRRLQAQQAALLSLGDRLREAQTTAEVVAAASETLGRTLAASRTGYSRIDLKADLFDVERDWTAPGVASLAGRTGLSLFRATIDALGLGKAIAIDSVPQEAWLEPDLRSYEAISTRAQIQVPLIDRGELVGILYVHQTEPRRWGQDEIDFAHGVADRTYAALAKVRAEADQAVLNQELSHRMKNMLAMVQAIAMQTLRTVPNQEPVEAFSKRLHALATASDTLLQQSWLAARIHTVAAAVTNTFGPDRFTVSGPDINLGPRATLSLSLLLHELTTNALKYGALSGSTGHVAVAWHIVERAGEHDLVLAWRETGGPTVGEPTRKGFGSKLIRTGLIGAGGADLRYASSGFEADFTAPLAQLQAL